MGELADFYFTIKYRPGKTNVDADTLSRFPVRLTDHLREYTEIVPPEVVTTIWQGNQAEMEEDVPRTVALQIRVEVDNLPAACLPVFTPEDIRDAQNGDENICEVVKLKKSGWNPKDKDLSSISIET